jgi:hypothetical protein
MGREKQVKRLNQTAIERVTLNSPPGRISMEQKANEPSPVRGCHFNGSVAR